MLPTLERHPGSAVAAAQLIKNNIYFAPEALLPHPDDADVFTAFFGTFLTSTFDVVEKPGTQGIGPIRGCTCDICVRIVKAPHLKAKKLYAQDKRRAIYLIREHLASVVAEKSLVVSEDDLNALANSTETRRDAALITYCHWLILRLRGECDGPGVLALWRIISRSTSGGILKDFTLTVEEYRIAEDRIHTALLDLAT